MLYPLGVDNRVLIKNNTLLYLIENDTQYMCTACNKAAGYIACNLILINVYYDDPNSVFNLFISSSISSVISTLKAGYCERRSLNKLPLNTMPISDLYTLGIIPNTTSSVGVIPGSQ